MEEARSWPGWYIDLTTTMITSSGLQLSERSSHRMIWNRMTVNVGENLYKWVNKTEQTRKGDYIWYSRLHGASQCAVLSLCETFWPFSFERASHATQWNFLLSTETIEWSSEIRVVLRPCLARLVQFPIDVLNILHKHIINSMVYTTEFPSPPCWRLSKGKIRQTFIRSASRSRSEIIWLYCSVQILDVLDMAAHPGFGLILLINTCIAAFDEHATSSWPFFSEIPNQRLSISPCQLHVFFLYKESRIMWNKHIFFSVLSVWVQ